MVHSTKSRHITHIIRNIYITIIMILIIIYWIMNIHKLMTIILIIDLYYFLSTSLTIVQSINVRFYARNLYQTMHIMFQVWYLLIFNVCAVFECMSNNHNTLPGSLVPRLLPTFQCLMLKEWRLTTLKSWEWPGNEAIIHW